jgi:hypothetical protein
MTLVLALLFSCATSTKAECSAEEPCGFAEECIAGQCVSRTCATSDQCGIEEYCSNDNTCVSGCEADTDCMFGDICNATTATCETGECADTHLDCGFGEFCSVKGDCYDAGGYFCQDCEDDGDCGGNGNICFYGNCGVACDDDRDCPGGYSCIMPYEDFRLCYAPCYLQAGKE